MEWIKNLFRKKKEEPGEIQPAPFEEANLELKAPADMPECGSLPVFLDKKAGVFISFWKVDRNAIKKIKKDKGIWLGVIASSHPPVFLTTEKPIKENP